MWGQELKVVKGVSKGEGDGRGGGTKGIAKWGDRCGSEVNKHFFEGVPFEEQMAALRQDV